MNTSALPRWTLAWAVALSGLIAPATGSASCSPEALVDALAQVRTSAPHATLPGPLPAMALQAAERQALPALTRIESLMGSVGVRWAWHRLEAGALDAALHASGGALVVARVEGGAPRCQVLTHGARTLDAATPSQWLALLPVQGGSEASVQPLQEVLRSLQADFRMAMRVGGHYAPQGAWVVSPWLSEASLRRVSEVEGPQPMVQDSRVRVGIAGLGLTRGLTADTALTLLLHQQRSRSDTTVKLPPAQGNLPVAQRQSTQDDTLAGLALYSRWVHPGGAVPAVLLTARALAPSSHSRAGGQASLTTLYELGQGWAVAASAGVDAERPELGASRFGRSVTVGASAQLSPQWLVTADAGRRRLREQPGCDAVQRLRVYRSFGTMAYVGLVVDREGEDRRITVTFARPW